MIKHNEVGRWIGGRQDAGRGREREERVGHEMGRDTGAGRWGPGEPDEVWQCST